LRAGYSVTRGVVWGREEGDGTDAATRHMYEAIAASDRGGPVNPSIEEEMFGRGRGRSRGHTHVSHRVDFPWLEQPRTQTPLRPCSLTCL
jgi:hypothetical protein